MFLSTLSFHFSTPPASLNRKLFLLLLNLILLNLNRFNPFRPNFLLLNLNLNLKPNLTHPALSSSSSAYVLHLLLLDPFRLNLNLTHK
jgi:hypothetical protein